jgi:phosphatidylglycerol:prolipoprotein diacylglycerol transferase
MLPVFHIGGIAFYTYGLMVGLALVTAYILGEIDIKRAGFNLSMSVMMPALILGGLIGSHLDSVIVYSSHHDQLNIHELLDFSHGQTFFGALIGGAIAMAVVCRGYGVPFLRVLDCCYIVPISYAVGRMGCLLSGDGDYGIPTSLPWGMSFPRGLVPTTARVHPLPLYEAAYATAIFFLLWPMGRRGVYGNRPMGEIFARLLTMMGACRFLTEFLSRNIEIAWGLTEAQIVSLVMIVLGVVLRSVLRRPYQLPVPRDSHLDQVGLMTAP